MFSVTEIFNDCVTEQYVDEQYLHIADRVFVKPKEFQQIWLNIYF